MDPCDVCNSDKKFKTNKLLNCAKCKVTLHQKCYSLIKINNEWNCDYCVTNSSEEKQCIACPDKTGALCQTTDHNWIHVVCVLFIPNAFFYVNFNNLVNVSSIKKRCTKLLCEYCKIDYGFTIKCSKVNCKVLSHVKCASIRKLLQSRKQFKFFCEEHHKVFF